MLIKCPCHSCENNIEFEQDMAGEKIACPHCGAETKLFLPIIATPAKPAPPVPAPVLKVKWQPTIMIPLLAIGVGAALFFFGIAETSAATTVFQQIIAAFHYCTGLIVIGIGFILDSLRSIARNQ